MPPRALPASNGRSRPPLRRAASKAAHAARGAANAAAAHRPVSASVAVPAAAARAAEAAGVAAAGRERGGTAAAHAGAAAAAAAAAAAWRRCGAVDLVDLWGRVLPRRGHGRRSALLELFDELLTAQQQLPSPAELVEAHMKHVLLCEHLEDGPRDRVVSQDRGNL